MDYHFKVHEAEEGGYWAEGIELKNICTQGDTMEELMYYLDEALNLYLDDPKERDFPLPELDVQGEMIVKVKVHPRIAFAIYLRNFRKIKNMTQLQMAETVGISPLNSYQRYEKTSKANPTLNTINKFLTAFPDFDISMILA